MVGAVARLGNDSRSPAVAATNLHAMLGADDLSPTHRILATTCRC